MRLVMVMVLAGLMALPQSVSAQAGEEGTTVQPSAEEPAPSSEPASKEPALQLKLDAAGVDVTPSPPRTVDGYTLEDAIQFLICGAAAVQVGTANYIEPDAAIRVGEGISAYLERNGLASVAELTGSLQLP